MYRTDVSTTLQGIDDVNSLVEQERKDAQRLKDIRHDEREKTDNLLKEKLKRKKEVIIHIYNN